LVSRHGRPFALLIAVGGVALLVAIASLVDLALPRPWDGVVLEGDTPGQLLAREVVPGSGAERAGLLPGDRILGINRDVLRSPRHAAEMVSRFEIGQSVPYLVRRGSRVAELKVELGRRFLADGTYLYATLLGFLFLAVGSFVLVRQPNRRPAQVFFVVCVLFLLFLVCRLRPLSYSWVDRFALHLGALALLLLPASFLHFFLIFPRPVGLRPRRDDPDYRRRRRRWIATLAYIYALPPLVLVARLVLSARRGEPVRLISGAPADNWYVLAVYMLVGLGVLAHGWARLEDPRQRRGAGLIFLGSALGLLPFLAAMVWMPVMGRSERFLLVGLVPLILVPITFAVSIIRFGLLDIRVILRKSLAYSVLTAAITLAYALAITVFNMVTRGSRLADSPWFPAIFALAIAFLFEPTRRWSQGLVDRLMFAERSRLQQAIQETGEQISAQLDLQRVVSELVERLPKLLGVRFAGLYLPRDGRLVRVAGPASLPAELAESRAFSERPSGRSRLLRPEEIRSAGVDDLGGGLERLEAAGVELVGDLSTSRRRIGLAVFSGSEGQLVLDEEELGLLSSLLGQAALALETGILVEERTRQAELERDLEIAAAVQNELLPETVTLGDGWQVAAVCQPARHVGGDFFAELPGRSEGRGAIVYGDVAGKSVSGALVMMAAHEALQTLALTHPDPGTLFTLANQRLYRLGPRKSFVSAAWIAASEDGEGIEYVVAGQPQLLLRRAAGEVCALPLPDHRLPLGALLNGGFSACRAAVRPGELVVGYSDGVVEAQSQEGEMFGEERLIGILQGGPFVPQDVVSRVLEAIRQFTDGAEPYDDITLVAIARDPEVTI